MELTWFPIQNFLKPTENLWIEEKQPMTTHVTTLNFWIDTLRMDFGEDIGRWVAITHYPPP